jgi:hypothetical protein
VKGTEVTGLTELTAAHAPLWTLEDLAAHWRLDKELAAKPEATKRRIRDMAARMKLKAVELSAKEKRWRPVDVLKAEEAAARR